MRILGHPDPIVLESALLRSIDAAHPSDPTFADATVTVLGNQLLVLAGPTALSFAGELAG